MSLQNIGAGNRDDAFYRYKMPRLVTKIEGRGNGIKTNVVNMVEVAKALARPPSYTTKFFGCELGAQSKYDEKTCTSIVNGAHETAKLAGLLEIFIKKYVQCYGCGNPETIINISKSQLITLKCAACGFLSDVDMRDKLTTFIIKNPPEPKKRGKKDNMRRAEKERLKEGELVDKVKKELKKKKAQDEGKAPKKKLGSDEELSSQGDEEGIAEVEEDDDVEWQTDTSAEAAQRRIQEQLTSATSEMVMTVEDPLMSPSTKVPKDGKLKLLRKSASKKDDASSEDSAEIKLPKLEGSTLYNVLVNELREALEKGSSPSQLVSLLEKKPEPPQEIMNVYFEALFEGFFKGIAKEVARRKLYLVKAVSNEASQRRLLVTLETFCVLAPPDVAKEIALVLKVLYDEDILEEDQILAWFDNMDSVDPRTLQVRRYAQPFVDWLRDAEADDNEE